ncbi:selenocysteine lyase/cysteine desulfurase [Nonomuraea thailandensis]|uniref:Selenocysteine lyase/cysteine desulfurase n=1 Tax=Nonomuraea thailandensis TaxID=1188745 RepID=A0A9X2G729_9ACTN|nr:aminotransferase class V-fold PLP-dependent enzyme [Nonomuraea thailandensis]MCP2353481.1 selenocysteine lyase/cysteine desulfurase [Nonomuraea thailandensis]
MNDILASTLDIQALRADTPATTALLHANNAGASLQPQPVTDTVLNYLALEQQRGGYEAAIARHAEREAVYADLARLIGAQSRQIAITDSATRAWNLAFASVPFRPGDRILTSMAEYASNYLAFLHLQERLPVTVTPVPSDETGQLSVRALADLLDDRVRLVAVTHIPTNGGLVNPAAAIGELVADSQALFLLDACQSVGQMPVDVGEIQADLLTTTGRKYLRGPRGTGFLYVSDTALDVLRPPIADLFGARWTERDSYTLRRDARRFELYESNIAATLGLGAAARYAAAVGPSASWARIRALAERLREGLAAEPGITLTDQGHVKGGIVTFTVRGWEPPQLVERLRARDINIWHSSIESTRLDMEKRGLRSVVRASVHYFNTEQEIDRLVEAIGSAR